MLVSSPIDLFFCLYEFTSAYGHRHVHCFCAEALCLYMMCVYDVHYICTCTCTCLHGNRVVCSFLGEEVVCILNDFMFP